MTEQSESVDRVTEIAGRVAAAEELARLLEDRDELGHASWDRFYPNLADAILSSDWLARVKAEALEDAAEDVSRMYAGTDGTDAEKAWIGGVDAAARRIRDRAATLRSGVK